MPTRLASLPAMAEKIERIERIFPKAQTLYSEDGAHCVIISEDADYTYLVRLDLDFTTLDAVVTGAAMQAGKWLPVEIPELEAIIA